MLGAVARLRRTLYGARVLRAESLPRPVVSVGNLTVGGTGKTPHVMFLAGWLRGQGVRVAILSRGYGRVSRGVVWVSDGSGSTPADADAAGDEPALLARSLPGVPVLVGESRLAAGREALTRCGIDAFLLDDGFQHLSLRRDADLLLVDAARGLANRRTLPLGPLREPPDHARYADALVVTKCADLGQGEATAASVPFPPDRPRAYSRLVPRSLVDVRGAAYALDSVGTDVAAFAVLARNEAFLSTLAEAGFRVRKFFPFRDHYRYRAGDLRRIADGSEGLPVVTTEKDLVRLPASPPFAVRALRVEVEVLKGWDELSRLLLDRIGRGGKR